MASDYRVLSYQDGDRVRAGVLVNGRVHPAEPLLGGTVPDAESVLGLLSNWDAVRSRLAAVIPRLAPDSGVPLATVRLQAPVLFPPAVFSAGANYLDHLAEMAPGVMRVTGREHAIARAAEPYITLKTGAHSIVGDAAEVRIPSFSSYLDWEAEIGVVIGRHVHGWPQDRWREAVAGFTIVNDLSARDKGKRDDVPFTFDWFAQKCFAGSAPMGPWITPLEFIDDPYNLDIKLWVNGMLKQDGNSRNMVFSIGELIEYVSTRFALRPGDVIMTGCPAGVGVARGEKLAPGDEIRIDVTQCGSLKTRIAA